MTGGIQETISISDKSEAHQEAVWIILKKARMFKTIMGASVKAELKVSNELVSNYAYYITRIAMLEINGQSVRLIRLCNPWSVGVEWKGSWSDESNEWIDVEDELKEALEHKCLPKGEFWMSFEDFYKNFHTLEFCNMTSDAYLIDPSVIEDKNSLQWKLVTFNGEWLPGFTAGGCGQFNEALFWTNPQFLVNIKNPDLNDNLATLLVSLMQKPRTDRYGKLVDPEFIQFRFYRVKKEEDADCARKTGMRLYASQLYRCGTSGKYTNTREVGKRYKVEPGYYLIIPSCYSSNRKAEFLLRVYTEQYFCSLDCKILDIHKDKLSYEDLFYFNKYDENESSNLLGLKKATEIEEAESEKIEIEKAGFIPIKTPVFETF